MPILQWMVALRRRDRKILISVLMQSTAESTDRCGKCEWALSSISFYQALIPPECQHKTSTCHLMMMKALFLKRPVHWNLKKSRQTQNRFELFQPLSLFFKKWINSAKNQFFGANIKKRFFTSLNRLKLYLQNIFIFQVIYFCPILKLNAKRPFLKY